MAPVEVAKNHNHHYHYKNNDLLIFCDAKNLYIIFYFTFSCRFSISGLEEKMYSSSISCICVTTFFVCDHQIILIKNVQYHSHYCKFLSGVKIWSFQNDSYSYFLQHASATAVLSTFCVCLHHHTHFFLCNTFSTASHQKV
jgi:hypothetical protein